MPLKTRRLLSDRTMTPMSIVPAGVTIQRIGRTALRTSWQLGRRAIPPATTIVNFRNACHDLRKRLENAVSETIEELYARWNFRVRNRLADSHCRETFEPF